MNRLLASLLILLGLLAPCSAAVTLDACGTSDVTAGNGTTTVTSVNFTNLTIASGSNRALVVVLNFGVATISGLTVVWDSGGANQSLTQINTANGTGGVVARADLWGLVNPVIGNKTLTVSWTTASDIYVDACSFAGVDQTGGATSFPNSTSVTGSGILTTLSTTVTSAIGDYVLAGFTVTGSGFSSVNNTQVFIDNTGAGCCNAAANNAIGAASVTMTGNFGAATSSAAVGTDIKAAASGGAACPALALLGVGC